MANVQLLDSKTHHKYRVIDSYEPHLGYSMGAIMVLPDEIKDVQREYPILLRKHPDTGKFFPNALLGFTENENLYLNGDGTWSSRYVPLAVRKGPFMIGFQDENGNAGNDPLVYIDLDDPRVSETHGENIFNDDGELSLFMNKTSHALLAIHQGYSAVETMVNALNEAELIEPLNVEITFDNGEQMNFGGAYIIAAEKLSALSAEQLKTLNDAGFLANAFYLAHSIANLRNLIDIKNSLTK